MAGSIEPSTSPAQLTTKHIIGQVNLVNQHINHRKGGRCFPDIAMFHFIAFPCVAFKHRVADADAYRAHTQQHRAIQRS